MPLSIIPPLALGLAIGLVVAIWTRKLLPYVLRAERFSRQYNPLDFRPVDTKRLTTVASLRVLGILVAMFMAVGLTACLVEWAT